MHSAAKLFSIGFVALLAQSVAAAELPKEVLAHVEGKQAEFQGICYLDKAGRLTFDEKAAKTVAVCIVGVPPQPVKTILISDENGAPVAVIEMNMDTKVQKVLWRKGDIGV